MKIGFQLGINTLNFSLGALRDWLGNVSDNIKISSYQRQPIWVQIIHSSTIFFFIQCLKWHYSLIRHVLPRLNIVDMHAAWMFNTSSDFCWHHVTEISHRGFKKSRFHRYIYQAEQILCVRLHFHPSSVYVINISQPRYCCLVLSFDSSTRFKLL